MRKLLLTIFLMSGIWLSADAAVVTLGDSSRTGELSVAVNYTYARGSFTVPGAEDYTLDSIAYFYRDATTDDTPWIGVYLAVAGAAPTGNNPLAQVRDTITDDVMSRRVSILSGTLTAGQTYVFAVGLPNTNGSSGFVGTTSVTSNGCFDCSPQVSPSGLSAPFTCDCGSSWSVLPTLAVWVYAHTAGSPPGGGGGGSGPRVMIRKKPDWKW